MRQARYGPIIWMDLSEYQMQLKDYLHNTRNKDETVYERFRRFGKSVGVSMDCVRKWIYKSRRIPDSMKLKIEDATNGKVTVRDMVNM